MPTPAQKWHQRSAVRAAVASGIFVMAAATITGVFSRPSATAVTYLLGNADSGRNKRWQHLEYSFTRHEYVHPLVIQELLGWSSDSTQTVTAVDLVAGNNSNRFFGDFKVNSRGEQTWITCSKPEGGGYFAYRYVGTSPSGIHILLCEDSGGGSGIFRSLILLSFHADTAIRERKGHLDTGKRVLLRTLGSIRLGDRYSGDITYEANVLKIGPDESPLKYGGRRSTTEIVIE